MSIFNCRLKGILKERNISQLELFKITGISPGIISNIVNGKQIPYPGWRKRIAEALGMPEDEIFPENDNEVG